MQGSIGFGSRPKADVRNSTDVTRMFDAFNSPTTVSRSLVSNIGRWVLPQILYLPDDTSDQLAHRTDFDIVDHRAGSNI